MKLEKPWIRSMAGPKSVSLLRISAASLTMLFLARCTASVEPPVGEPTQLSDAPLEKIVLATRAQNNLLVLSGSGRQLRTIQPPPDQTYPDGAWTRNIYASPAVHPDGSRFVYIHRIDRLMGGDVLSDLKSWLSQLEEWQEQNPDETNLMEASTETGMKRYVYRPPVKEFIASPVWSPSGDRLALLEGRDLVLLNALDYAEVDRVRDVLVVPVSVNESHTLAWGGEKTTIHIAALRDCEPRSFSCSGIGEIDLTSHRVSWLGPEGFQSDRLALGPMYAVQCGAGGLKVEMGIVQLPDIQAVQTLFGPPSVCREGSWSPGHRYYFSLNGKQGFFSADWLEGYDVQTGRVFRVKTLERRFYSE